VSAALDLSPRVKIAQSADLSTVMTYSPGVAELKQGPGDIGDQLSIPPPGFWLVWG